MNKHQETIEERRGMFRNVPRFLRRAIERRLTEVELDSKEFDQQVVLHFAKLKRMYALLHIQAGERAKATLFETPPVDSPRFGLKQLAKTKSSHEAAMLVRKYRLPYLLVESATGGINPQIAIALIETMEPDELLACLPLLARRGLIEGQVRRELLVRLSALSQEEYGGASYQTVTSIIRQAKLDREVSQALFELVPFHQSVAVLEGNTGLLVDGSLSMDRDDGSLELATGVGFRIDQALEPAANLSVVVFQENAEPIKVSRRSTIEKWRRALTLSAQRAGTSVGAAVEQLIQEKVSVNRLVIITDGYENRAPRLVSALEQYENALGLRPKLMLVQPENSGRQVAMDLKDAQISHQVFAVDSHLLGLDVLTASLAENDSTDQIGLLIQVKAFSSSYRPSYGTAIFLE